MKVKLRISLRIGCHCEALYLGMQSKQSIRMIVYEVIYVFNNRIAS